MTFLRLLNIQGIAGLAASLALLGLLLVQKVETHHWRKQSGQYEQLYRGDQAAFATTVANYRAAADAARTADQATAERVVTEQRTINEGTSHDFEARLADARATADRLRFQVGATAANRGGRRATPVPALSAAASGPPQAAGQNGLSPED